jgi:hypothetical protein
MWGRKRQTAEAAPPADAQPSRLKESLRQARVELAERTSVVVDLRDAELARLELLNDALDPLFAEIPPEADLFDRGVSRGDTPRLWLDAIACVVMGRDKRLYRFVQDTRYGRKVLAESTETKPIVEAVTHYVATRLIERERALAADTGPLGGALLRDINAARSGQRWRLLRAFIFGVVLGCVSLFAALWIVASRLPH